MAQLEGAPIADAAVHITSSHAAPAQQFGAPAEAESSCAGAEAAAGDAFPNKLLALLEAADLTSDDEPAAHPKRKVVGSDDDAPATKLGMHVRKMRRLSE